MESRTDLMRGTLDLLILRSLTAMPLHGLGIARRIAQMTQGSFDVKAGLVVSRPLSPRGARPGHVGVGRIRYAAAGEVLPRDPARQEAAAGRRSQLAAHRGGDGARPGVRLMTRRGSPLHWLRMRSCGTCCAAAARDAELRADIDGVRRSAHRREDRRRPVARGRAPRRAASSAAASMP